MQKWIYAGRLHSQSIKRKIQRSHIENVKVKDNLGDMSTIGYWKVNVQQLLNLQ